MYLRTLLVAALCIGLNSSLCTGGLFAVTAAATDQLAYSEDASGPMSYGSIGYLSCKSSTRNSSDLGSLDLGGCKNAKSCFTQATSILGERLVPVLLSVSDVIPLDPLHLVSDKSPPDKVLLARAGPLYEYSKSQAHSLLKLE